MTHPEQHRPPCPTPKNSPQARGEKTYNNRPQANRVADANVLERTDGQALMLHTDTDDDRPPLDSRHLSPPGTSRTTAKQLHNPLGKAGATRRNWRPFPAHPPGLF